jgi:hypothetical protein
MFVKGVMSMKQLIRVSVLIIACSMMLSCSESSEKSDTGSDGIVAQIGSVTVTTRDLTQALKGMPGPQQFEYLADEGRKVLIDLILDWKLLSREAVKVGLDTDPAVGAMLKNAPTEYEREQVLGNAYLRYRIETLPPVSDEQIQDYYAGHSSDFSIAERRKVNRIFFVTEERAREALPQLQAGVDFVQYKKQHSEERIKVSTLWLQAAQNPGPFEKAVLTLNAGEISDIIPLKSGYCIARVLEKIPAKVLTLEEVRERVRSQLQDRNERELISDIRQTLRQGYSVEINTGLLESYECGECDGSAVDLPGNTQPSA